MKRLLFNRNLMFLLMTACLLFSTATAQDETPYKFYIGGEYTTD